MNNTLAIQSISLNNFRNYELLDLQNLGHLVVVVGDNAVGKTNIIEGLQLMSMLESFRKPSWSDVVQKGKKEACIYIEFCQNNQKNSMVLMIKENKRSYLLNEKIRQNQDLVGQLPAVLFTPDDLQIVKGAAEQRRCLVDDLGSQLSRTFYELKQDYTRVVKQKNSLLREEYIQKDVLSSWNRNLTKLGTSLMQHRIALFERLTNYAKDIYEHIAPTETLTVEYIPSWNLIEKESSAKALPTADLEHMLEAYYTHELRQRRALIGAHRDEVMFYIDGKNARQFGSQGQQRSIALALKIAEVEILRELKGVNPILLLDDVMSEIDEKRRTVLLELINSTTQTFITTTHLNYFDKEILKNAHVIKLPLKETTTKPAKRKQ
jgi:DNA replication and repair protein RecF